MLAALKSQFTDWLHQPRTPEAGPIVLSQRRVYILPTRHSLIFGVVLVMMLLGSINYGLSLGFVLTFLLAVPALNGMLYTFRNLARLHVSAIRTTPVFAGEAAIFSLHLSNPGELPRHAIGLSRERRPQGSEAFTDVPANASARISIAIPGKRRGRLTLFTRFPLGLYQAWSHVHPDVSCIIYPRPAPAGLPLPQAEAAAGSGASYGTGQDDFAGLRSYHMGDPPRHVAWKAAARGQGLLTKQLSGQAASEVWLAWALLPPRMEAEEKIACLTRWVLDAHALRMAYACRVWKFPWPVVTRNANAVSKRWRSTKCRHERGSSERGGCNARCGSPSPSR